MSKTITVGGKSVEVSDEQFDAVSALLEEQRKEINGYEDLVGEKIFFRAITYHVIGEVKKVVGGFVHLKNASWVADTGRFMNCINFIKDGVQTNSEIEPVGDMFLNMDTVVDFFIWKHQLPKEQKKALDGA